MYQAMHDAVNIAIKTMDPVTESVANHSNEWKKDGVPYVLFSENKLYNEVFFIEYIVY